MYKGQARRGGLQAPEGGPADEADEMHVQAPEGEPCLFYTSSIPRDRTRTRISSSSC